MPLVTAIERNGKDLDLPWDYFHLSCMLTAAFKEALPDEPINYKDPTKYSYGQLEDHEWVDFSMSPIYYLEVKPPVLSEGRQVLKTDHHFVGATSEGEVIFELKAGDVLKAHREYKH